MSLRDAILSNPFMTGECPTGLFFDPVIGELRSYLPPEVRVTTLALCLYSAGLTPHSWAREGQWMVAASREQERDLYVAVASAQVSRSMAFSVGLTEALLEAESMARESGRRLVDPETGAPMFPDEETLQ